MTPPPLDDSLRWLGAGTAFVLERVDSVDLAAGSVLPGWSNGHVVAHLSRNADALMRLLRWAATGIETPMYASTDARGAEIERDRRRPDDVQRADAHDTADQLARCVRNLDEQAWVAQVRSARGRLIPATEVPWMRVKEVWLHAVDLGASIGDLPADLVAALLTDVVGSFEMNDPRPDLELVSPDRSWRIGGGQRVVAGPAPQLLGWLVGRTSGQALVADAALPALPDWL